MLKYWKSFSFTLKFWRPEDSNNWKVCFHYGILIVFQFFISVSEELFNILRNSLNFGCICPGCAYDSKLQTSETSIESTGSNNWDFLEGGKKEVGVQFPRSQIATVGRAAAKGIVHILRAQWGVGVIWFRQFCILICMMRESLNGISNHIIHNSLFITLY